MRNLLLHFSILVAGLALIGCGGSGSSTSGPSAATPGIYRATYDRAVGNVLIQVRPNGSATVRIFDGLHLLPWEANAHVNANGRLSGTTNNLSGTVSFDLAFSGENNTSQVGGTVTILGETVTAEGGYAGDGTTSLFAGIYSGLLTPTVGEAFDIDFTIALDGNMEVDIVDNTGNYSGTGTVDALGKVSFSADGVSAGSLGKTISGSGYVTFLGTGYVGYGAFSAGSGMNGSWAVSSNLQE